MVYLSAFCISTYLYVNGNTQYDTATMETADQVRLVFDVITLVCTAVGERADGIGDGRTVTSVLTRAA